MRISLLPLLLATACNVDPRLDRNGDSDVEVDERGCTLEANPSVAVTVENGAGASIPEAAVTYSVDESPFTDCTSPNGEGYACGIEEPGWIEVRVSVRGATVERALAIELEDDGCHVRTALATFVFVD